jgi:hypothetical protein
MKNRINTLLVAFSLTCTVLFSKSLPQEDNLALWLDASDASSFELTPTGKVKVWSSKDPQAVQVYQYDKEIQPELKRKAFNKLSAVYFTPEIQEYLVSDLPLEFNPKAATLFYVLQNETVSTDQNASVFSIAGPSNPAILLRTRANGQLQYGQLHDNKYVTLNVNVDLGIPLLMYSAYSMEEGMASFDVDGYKYVEQYSDSAEVLEYPIASNAGNLTIGTQKINLGEPPAYRSFGGYLCEVIFYKTKLSQAEIDTVYSYLRKKWDL